jgi:hypothetical protein
LPVVEVTMQEGATGCPDSASLAAAVARVAGHPALDAVGADRDPRARYGVTFARRTPGPGYTATVRTGGGTAVGMERILSSASPDCADLAGAVTVTLGLMLDRAAHAAPAAAAAPDPRPSLEDSAGGVHDDDEPALLERPPVDPDERTAYNAIHVELAGSALYYSVNYERLLWGGRAGVRVGASYLQSTGSSSPFPTSQPPATIDILSFPLVASYYLGSARHKLQLGAGVTTFYRSGHEDTFFNVAAVFGSIDQGVSLAGTLAVGYRFFPLTGGVGFGATFTPLVGTRGVLPWGGCDLGAVF